MKFISRNGIVVEYNELLLKAVKSAGAENLGIFEYYCDAIFF